MMKRAMLAALADPDSRGMLPSSRRRSRPRTSRCTSNLMGILTTMWRAMQAPGPLPEYLPQREGHGSCQVELITGGATASSDRGKQSAALLLSVRQTGQRLGVRRLLPARLRHCVA